MQRGKQVWGTRAHTQGRWHGLEVCRVPLPTWKSTRPSPMWPKSFPRSLAGHQKLAGMPTLVPSCDPGTQD